MRKALYSFLFLGTFLCSLLAGAQVFSDDLTSTVVSVAGEVKRAVQNNNNWVVAVPKDELKQGDQIQTWEGKTTLLLSDESMLKLNRNTHLTMSTISKSASWSRTSGLLGASPTALKSKYRLHSGESWIRNNNNGVDIEIETPTVTASLRGTELNIKLVSADLVQITVLEGKVFAANAAGSVEAVAGEIIIAALGQPPRKQTLLSPQDSVQWTVRIPNLLNRDEWLEQTQSESQANLLERVFEDLAEHKINSAQQHVNSLNLDKADSLNVLNALVKMSDGNFKAALTEFERLAVIDNTNVGAWRGVSITSLLLNQKNNAIEAAQTAVELNSPSVSTDWQLLAYAQRANFDLTAAEESIARGLEIEANNPLSLTMLALLQFADGRLTEAQDSIEAALRIDAKDSLAHSMKGFISLSQRDHAQSKLEFRTALNLDSQNSEAYLGLGLLMMRQGNVVQAQKNINTAIALEPQRSLYLSYWAKMLHQAERYQKALDVLDSAARLDPQDPTPHFYKAIIQHDLFLAGESIDSLQRSIDLNDNRAVYRSRLLLDQDLASRNINLATVYGALGMNLIANQKAIESSTENFRNFSAHLFLSSTLSNAGRVFPAGSEALVSGVLLPANANSLSSINDYSTFFEGPEFDSNLSLAFGNMSTHAASLSLAGVLPDSDLSYGLLATSDKTDGWRGDNGEELTSFSSTVKWQANPRDSFRARVSFSDAEQQGGSFNRFEIDQPPNADAKLDSTDSLLDLSYRRELSNHSDWLTNLLIRDTKFDFIDTRLLRGQPQFLIDESTSTDRETIQLQTQYSTRLKSHQLFIGSIYFDGKQTLDFSQQTFLSNASGARLPAPAATQSLLDQADSRISQLFDSKRDLKFNSVYVDDNWFISNKLTVQVAAYFEDFDNGTTNQSKLNPRIGVVWSPTKQDTIRVAGFRYILPQVQSRLHPTHIGGVFITRNTEEGALVEEIDFVWEHKWQRGMFSINLFDLNREKPENITAQAETISRSELNGAGIAVNQLFGKRFGLAAGIGLSQLKDDFILLQSNRDETNASISINYLSPTGVSGSLRQTYRNINFTDSSRSTESIFMTNLSLSYTFRNRQATIGVVVSNLFDKEFNWITDAFTTGRREPARRVLASASWNF